MKNLIVAALALLTVSVSQGQETYLVKTQIVNAVIVGSASGPAVLGTQTNVPGLRYGVTIVNTAVSSSILVYTDLGTQSVVGCVNSATNAGLNLIAGTWTSPGAGTFSASPPQKLYLRNAGGSISNTVFVIESYGGPAGVAPVMQ